MNEIISYKNNSAQHALPRSALKSVMYLNSQWAVPRSMGIDGALCYGGSSGTGINLIRKAHGEFDERDHFFHEIKIDYRATIDSLPTHKLQHQWITLLEQLSQNHEISKHSFAWSQVRDFKNQQQIPYLYNGLSLTLDAQDTPFFPFSDSCACATHSNAQLSIDNALQEFIERQSFLASWLGEKAHYAIDPNVLLELSTYPELVQNMLEHGDIFAFELNHSLPGYCVVLFYFAKDSRDRVQYAIGASADYRLDKALSAAFVELWQCYSFLYNVDKTETLKDKAGSSFHLKFISYNTQETKSLIPYFKVGACKLSSIADISDVKNAQIYRQADVIAGLQQEDLSLYYYHKFDAVKQLYFTKIVSPDYFIHMALDEPLNISNGFSQLLGIDPQNAYRVRLPFP